MSSRRRPIDGRALVFSASLVSVVSLFGLVGLGAVPARAAPPPDPAPVPAPVPAPDPATDPELEKLLKDADDAAGPSAPATPGAPAAPAGGGGMNVSNPEISAVFDGVAVLVPERPHVTELARSGFFLREMELSLASWIDHLARFKAFVSFSPDGVDVEELTVFWPGLLGPVNLTVGRFRQSLDPLNRWHAHALDQADLPLVHRDFLGDEGLAQTGVRLDTVFGSAAALTHLVQVEITDSENPVLLAGELFSAPSFLGHLSNHLALGDAGYVELGGGALLGYRNRTAAAGELDPTTTADASTIVAEPTRRALLVWGDFTAAYDPPGGRDRFNLFFRSGLFYRDVDGQPSRTGGYAYLHSQLDRAWTIGVRGDWVEAGDGQPETFAVVPAITFWQSEYLYLRLQYQLGLPRGEEANHTIMLQLDAGIGPHYHDRY